MKTITKELYEYADLILPQNREILEKVLQNEYDINTSHDDWWYSETYYTAAKLMGFYDFDIYFSGFHSQGDGACFKSRYQYEKQSVEKLKSEFPQWEKLHEIAERLKELQRVNFYQVLGSTKHWGFYFHEYCMDINLERNDNKPIINEDEFIEAFRDFARLIYKSINKDYDYLTSEEAILETIQANEYTFNESGKIEY